MVLALVLVTLMAVEQGVVDRALAGRADVSLLEWGRAAVRPAEEICLYQVLDLVERVADPRRVPHDGAALRVESMARRADELLWLQHRVVAEVSDRVAREHAAMMRQPGVHLVLDDRLDALRRFPVQRASGGWLRPPLSRPAGWHPTLEPGVHARWELALGDPRTRVAGDAFQVRALAHLAYLARARSDRPDPGSSSRMLDALAAAEAAAERLRGDWVALERTLGPQTPAEVHASPDPDLQLFTQRLRELRRRSRAGR